MTNVLRPSLDPFFTYLESERRLSKNTIKSYWRDLDQFVCFCDHKKIASWVKVTIHDIRAFVAHRHRDGLSGRSIQRELSAVRRFLDYLVREMKIEHNPARGVSAPKYHKPLPKPIDVDQMGQLLRLNNKEDNVLVLRDIAIMELLYSCGLRISEAVTVNIGDIDFTEGNLVVEGKGAKMRKLPVGRFARDRIKTWLKSRDSIAQSDEPALFVSKLGRRLSVRSIQQRMKFWGAKQGLDINVHPHRLRHSFASHLLESSGNLRAVQELLGHADISTTQVYTHLDFQHLASVYDKSHPRARKK